MLKKLTILFVLLASVLGAEARKRTPVVPDSLERITVNVNGVPLEMQRVEGGSFMMGATADQTDAEIYNDKPAHLVFLSPFYIATTEVTTTLWQKIMTEREVLSPKGFPTHPINYVT